MPKQREQVFESAYLFGPEHPSKDAATIARKRNLSTRKIYSQNQIETRL